MGTDAAISAEIRSIIDAALRGRVSPEQAARVYELGREAVSAFVLASTRSIAELVAGATAAPGPHTPSGAIPVYAKPAASNRRRGRPGARNGHDGHRRPAPVVIDRVEEVAPISTCQECSGPSEGRVTHRGPPRKATASTNRIRMSRRQAGSCRWLGGWFRRPREQDRSQKMGIKNKRLMAGWDHRFLLSLRAARKG